MTRYFLAVLAFFFWNYALFPQIAELEELTIEDGLSQGFVRSFLQTKDGFLWMSTNAGLNRYDGNGFKHYLNDPFMPYSPSSNEHAYLFEDSRGWMWTKYGEEGGRIDIYDPTSGRFFHIKMDINTQQRGNMVFVEDHTGAVWYGSIRLDVPDNLLDTATQSELKIPFEVFTDFDPKDKWLHAYLASDSTFYFLTYRSLYKFNEDRQTFLTIHSFDDLPLEETESPQQSTRGASILEDPNGRIWISMDKVYFLENSSLIPTSINNRIKGNLALAGDYIYTGLWELDRFPWNAPNNTKLEIETLTPTESSHISQFKFFLVDRSGVLWIGTNGYGVRKFNPLKRKFNHYLPGQSLRSIFQDSKENVWVQSDIRPFERLDITTGQPTQRIDIECIDMMEDGAGNYWFSGEVTDRPEGRYLLRVDAETGMEKWFHPMVSVASVHVVRNQRALLDDGKIWLLGNDSIACFFIGTERSDYWDLSKIEEHQISPKPSFSCFVKSGEREFWAGSDNGLFHFILGEKGNEVLHQCFRVDPTNPKGINLNHITSLCLDPAEPHRFLWVGTNGSGINRMDLQTKTFMHIGKKDGLPDGVVYAILPSTKNDLWMSTNGGLSNYDPITGVFTNFTSEDGLQSNEFNGGSAFRAKDGTLFFGGVNGLNIFHPDSLRMNSHVPPISITGLSINNERIDHTMAFSDKKSTVLNTPIERASSIELSHHQNIIGIEYAALDFTSPGQNKYRHQLVGVNEDWVEAYHKTSVQYTNLPPGNYLFRVIGSNNDGIWSKAPATLKIIIHPPWWQTKWAYSAYFLSFLGGIFWLYRFQVKRVKERNQLAFEKKESERLAELDRIKTDFFSNVTHEFRTPLTLILEPIRQLLKKDFDGEVRQQLSLVKNNSEKMLALVNQLLDMAKLEEGKTKLDMRRGDILETIRPIFQSFLPLADKKDIELKMSGLREMGPFYFDKMKVEKVIANLLSNAVKFTSSGSVELNLKLTTFEKLSTFNLTVSDTGKGIPPNALPHIFDRFYQVDSSSTRAGEGTGIGLALTKELVELMGGTIEVESELGKGTTFKVTIPMPKEMEATSRLRAAAGDGESQAPVLNSLWDATSISDSMESAIPATEDMTTFPIPTTSSSLGKNVTSSAHAPTGNNHLTIQASSHLVLLIEDNAELRTFIKTTLDKTYQVIEASNGSEGIRKAKELIPDLIVSDVMMPEKDGYEVCDNLKNDWLTSHVPIILLTAKSAIDSKIKGLKTGADAYLTKPFHTEELQVRIEKLIEGRKHLQEKFSQGSKNQSIKKSVGQLPKIENQFLRQLTLLVEKHLDNEKLSVEALAEELLISRSQLFRKVKALTGQSPNEFVRNYRLDRAMELLKNKEGNISQIAMMVGFGDEKYFSTRFKGRFGQSPGEV